MSIEKTNLPLFKDLFLAMLADRPDGTLSKGSMAAAHRIAIECKQQTAELLEALEALAQRYRGSVALNDEHAALAEQAFAAIAKAKGEA